MLRKSFLAFIAILFLFDCFVLFFFVSFFFFFHTENFECQSENYETSENYDEEASLSVVR